MTHKPKPDGQRVALGEKPRTGVCQDCAHADPLWLITVCTLHGKPVQDDETCPKWRHWTERRERDGWISPVPLTATPPRQEKP